MGCEHGFPSPSSALFVKQVMVQAEECGWPPTSRPHLSLFLLFHPCLVLSCPVFLTISSPYFTVLSACGGTGMQRAPGTCQTQRDGNSGAEKPRVRQTNGPVRGPVWGWASLALILCRKFSDPYLGIALSVSAEEECEETAV